MISIPRIEKPIAWLTRLIRVAILCSACRLRNESGVSSFDSGTRANLRLKLAVASMGLVLFNRRLQWAFRCPLSPILEPCLLTPTRKAERSLRKNISHSKKGRGPANWGAGLPVLWIPDDLARLRLPDGVQQRLTELLDKQDEGLALTDAEQHEAEGLVNLAEFLSLLRTRSERVSS
jgi:hypothetical protein